MPIAIPLGQNPPTIVIKPEGGGGFYDARTGMPPGIPGGAMCVQRFDDSLNSAIHITYRISLRSSSMWEPRDPLLKVLTFFCFCNSDVCLFTKSFGCCSSPQRGAGGSKGGQVRRGFRWGLPTGPNRTFNNVKLLALPAPIAALFCVVLGNDPSAGSPTETLLRLLLPLNEQV